MSTTEQTAPRAVLGFTPPDPLRGYAQLTVFAETVQGFEEFRAMLADADHTVSMDVHYNAQTGVPFTVLHWQEGDVTCSCHGPKGYPLAEVAA